MYSRSVAAAVASALVGVGNDSFTLKPLALAGPEGAGVNLGVSYLNLEPAPPK